MTDLEWLDALKVNSWSIEKNEHAACYVSAQKYIDDDYFGHGGFKRTLAPILEEMRKTNTIYRLQIYPRFPTGFYSWYGPTLASVIEQARSSEGEWNCD